MLSITQWKKISSVLINVQFSFFAYCMLRFLCVYALVEWCISCTDHNLYKSETRTAILASLCRNLKTISDFYEYVNDNALRLFQSISVCLR